jgi:hypothetical protein
MAQPSQGASRLRDEGRSDQQRVAPVLDPQNASTRRLAARYTKGGIRKTTGARANSTGSIGVANPTTVTITKMAGRGFGVVWIGMEDRVADLPSLAHSQHNPSEGLGAAVGQCRVTYLKRAFSPKFTKDRIHVRSWCRDTSEARGPA